MANYFQREPINSGDQGIWGTPELRQNRIAYGILTCQLYDDAGVLKATVGKVGLQDDSINGVCLIDTITTVSLAAVSNSNWFKVEVSRTGTTVNFTASDIAGDTDPAELPASFDAAYDPEKGGYHINSNLRTIAVGYKDGSGDLKGIINCDSVIEGYHGKTYSTGSTLTIHKVVDGIDEIYTYEGVVTHTLPALSGNEGRIVTVQNSGTNIIIVDGNGAETINGIATAYLYSQYDYIKLLARENEWIVLNSRLTLRSGMITCSTWTNRHLGLSEIDYDNLSGAFTVGELITGGGSGDTGIIIKDTGSTLTLINVTGGGNFQDDEEITGSTSGETADVDEAGGGAAGNKDEDANIYHGFVINIDKIKIRMLLSSDGTYNNSFELNSMLRLYDQAAPGAVDLMSGILLEQVDTSNVKIQSGENGIHYIDDAGGAAAMADDFYEIILEFNI